MGHSHGHIYRSGMAPLHGEQAYGAYIDPDEPDETNVRVIVAGIPSKESSDVSQLKSLRGTEVKLIIEREGWICIRDKGPHLMYEHPDGRQVGLAVNNTKIYGASYLLNILKKFGIDPRRNGGNTVPRTKTPLNKALANRLRNSRVEHGLNQQQLAKKIGVHPTHLNKMELGNRPITPEIHESLKEFFKWDQPKATEPETNGATVAEAIEIAASGAPPSAVHEDKKAPVKEETQQFLDRRAIIPSLTTAEIMEWLQQQANRAREAQARYAKLEEEVATYKSVEVMAVLDAVEKLLSSSLTASRITDLETAWNAYADAENAKAVPS